MPLLQLLCSATSTSSSQWRLPKLPWPGVANHKPPFRVLPCHLPFPAPPPTVCSLVLPTAHALGFCRHIYSVNLCRVGLASIQQPVPRKLKM